MLSSGNEDVGVSLRDIYHAGKNTSLIFM